MRGRVLVVDDKENIRRLFERMLGEHEHEVVTAADGSEAIAKLALGSFDLVISDIRMPGPDGLEVLEAAKRLAPGTEVILMTAYATVQNAIDAMRAGAWDYLLKPFEPDDVVLRVGRAIEHKKLRERAEELASEAQERHSFDRLLGRSEAMQRVFTLLEKAAGFDLTVLITGPSGTGKELAARAVHYASPRKAERFVAVNCGAFPAELLESELFGHVRGSFTGAVGDKRGLIEEAGRGTLFLDEVGELPLPLQVKLNRALQEREYRRVGETRDRRVEARIVAATNVNLREAVAEGRFREDLFYRLQVFPIALPPLRERQSDIPLLAAHFLERARERFGKAPAGFSPEALQALCRHDWPGNVRELENAIERAVVVCGSDAIQPDDLAPEITESRGAAAADALAHLRYRDAIELLRDRAVRDYLGALLRATGGNVSRAAERAGVARESLHRLLKRHGVEPDSFRA